MFTAEASAELILGPRQAQYCCSDGDLFHYDVFHDESAAEDQDEGAASTESAAEERPSSPTLVPDFVVDCIDDATTKAALVAFCLHHNIKMICALAAGGKSDPTRLRIGDLGDPMRDPLARKLRATLRKDEVWSFLDNGASKDGGRRHVNRKGVLPLGSGISCVYSTQNPVSKSL